MHMINATEARNLTENINSKKNSEILKDLDEKIRRAAQNGATTLTYYKALTPAVKAELINLKYRVEEYSGDPRDRADGGYTVIGW